MKTAKITVFTYTCEICGTKYEDRKRALICENRPVEKAEFQIGDVVSPIECRTTSHGQTYKLSGYVVGIKIEPPDSEYVNKWLKDKHRLHMHNLVYLVDENWRAKDGNRYYAPELRKSSLPVGKYFKKEKAN